jgi:hypothetical protein
VKNLPHKKSRIWNGKLILEGIKISVKESCINLAPRRVKKKTSFSKAMPPMEILTQQTKLSR